MDVESQVSELGQPYLHVLTLQLLLLCTIRHRKDNLSIDSKLLSSLWTWFSAVSEEGNLANKASKKEDMAIAPVQFQQQ
ncbi:hypothetical protein V6N13_075287 [Hibiscus sabdariffa]|uniref:Uncharacterized protein n=1 Tax=Hibiscus sabdariffa TaxID=183260 RepID=A0ABR2UBQ5_9ROSI